MRGHPILFAAILLLAPSQAAEPAADAAIAFLEARTKQDPDDFLAWAKLGDRCLQKLRETGDERYLQRARAAADASLKAIPAASNTAGLSLRARVSLAEHRFGEARLQAEELARLEPEKPASLAILADALLESGKLEEAEKIIAQMEERYAPALLVSSRRARLHRQRGNADAAVEAYRAAREASEEAPSRFWAAWAEVQLGELAFSRGKWDEAESHYTAALSKEPGWWVVQEHVAELRAAQGREEEARKLYEELSARIPRPELLQAVGDFHLHYGRKAEAKKWHDRALAAYLQANADGSVSTYHHLSGFYCDSIRNSPEAVKWARKDLELRDTAAARDALAWALYHNGQIDEAKTEIEKALRAKPQDAHILQHAAMIRMSAGDIAAGQAALREAAALNPRFQSFHVHR